MSKQTKAGRRLIFLTLCLTYISTGILAALPGASLPQLATNTHVSLALVGDMFALSGFGFMLGALLAGSLIAFIHPKYWMSLGLLLLGVGSVATALTTSFPLLLASQLVKGFGFGFIDISLNSMATLSFEENLTESLNNIHGMYGLGALLGPLILAFGLQFFNNFPFAYFVGSILGVAVVILALPQHVPAPPRRVKSDTPARSTNRAELRKVLLRGLLWLMLLQLSLYVAAELGFSNWIVSIVSKSAGISLVLAAPVATAFYIGLTAGRLGGAQVLRRGWLSEKSLLYVATVGGAIAGIIAALFPSQLFVAYLASALVGCFYGPLFPSIMALTNQRFAHAIGLVSSIMMVGTGASSMLLPTAMGALLPVIGINWVIAIPSICCLAIVPPMLLTNRTQRTTLQSSEMQHTMETSTEAPSVP